MRKFGLAAILSFVDKGATAAMGRIGRRARTLQDRFRGVGRGVAMMQRGLSSMAIGAAPVAGVFGLMIRKGAQFEQAIANLRAVSLDVANKTTPRLENLAKTLGATTVFSATQATDAMTALKRSGLTTNEVMGAIGGTLNAAAAEGIGLADAAGLVADNMKAFKIDASQAGAVAGKLALASARTNTNMLQLKEALKLAAPAAGLVGASLSDTTAVLGALADIGLKGTLGATGFRSAITKLVNPTKQGRKAMASLGLSMGTVSKYLDKGDVVGIFKLVTQRLKAIPSRTKAAGVAAKLFGLRGIAMAKALDLTDKSTTRFNETLELLRKESGETATAMAKIQLATLTGQVTLLKSAFEGVSIEMFGLISKETSGGVEKIAKTLGDLAFAMKAVSGQSLANPDDLAKLATTPAVFFEVARGIRDAFKDIKEFVGGAIESVKGVAKWFGIAGDEGARGTAKTTTKVLTLTAAMAPLSLGVIALTSLFGGLARVAVGAAKVVGNALAIAGKTAGGILGVIGKRLPKFGAFLGKAGGLLGKAGKFAEKAVAAPVRVVNFHEMALASKTGPLSNQLPLFGKSTAPDGKTVSALARFRSGLAGGVGKLGKFGTFLNSAAFSAKSAAGKLGSAGLVGAAGALGFAFGTLLDRTFGLSDKFYKFAWWLRRDEDKKKEINENIAFARKEVNANLLAARQLKQFANLAARGVKLQGPGGTKQAITQDVARARLVESLQKQGMTQAQQTVILGNMATLLAKIPVAGTKAPPTPSKPAKDALVSSTGFLPVSAGDVVLDRASLASAIMSQSRGGLTRRAVQESAPASGGGGGGGSVRIEVPVSIDGRAVALAVANVRLDDLERSGAELAPGQRAALLQRGFEDVT